MIMLLMMKPNDKNIESEIILEFEKIRPAITRLIQSQTKNKQLTINLGKSKNSNSNEIIINPSILVNSVSTSKLDFKDLIIGTVVHESIHSMQDYKFNIDEDLKKYENKIKFHYIKDNFTKNKKNYKKNHSFIVPKDQKNLRLINAMFEK